MENVKCRDCGTVYSEDQKICPQCGSKRKIVFLSAETSIKCGIKIEEMEGRNPHLPSRKKLRWRWISKDTVQRGDGVTRIHLFRSIDRDNDSYEEVVTDLETGRIIHECKEPLSEHRGHGSDKNRSNQGEA